MNFVFCFPQASNEGTVPKACIIGYIFLGLELQTSHAYWKEC